MKSITLKLPIILLALLIAVTAFPQGVVISDDANATPHGSAMLDVQSTEKGMLVPRMSQAQRDAISSPAAGLLIYQTDNTQGFYFNAGTPETPQWQNLSGSDGIWQESGGSIYRINGNIGIGESNPAGKLHVSSPGDWAGISFTGTGLNDLTVDISGYTGTGSTDYAIKIQNPGPDPNLIEISSDGGNTWSAPIPITPDIEMGLGVTANFGNTFGYTYDDRWDWTVNEGFSDVMIVQGRNIGIGTTEPTAFLHVEGMGSGEGNVLFTGEQKTPVNQGDPPVEGPGTRMMWYPDKIAFRVGRSDGTAWDKNNIGTGSTAWGINTTASGSGSTAWGANSIANSVFATAWGENTFSNGWYSTAWGYETNAEGWYSTAWGRETTAGAWYSTAWGYNANASAWYSTAWGAGTTASGSRATAWGENTEASGIGSTAWGFASTATASRSTAWGQSTEASGNNSTSWGSGTVASNSQATAWGQSTEASGHNSTAWGSGTVASNSQATAWGSNTTASRPNATAWGSGTTASEDNATAWGISSQATAIRATAWGQGTIASAGSATAWGRLTVASNWYSTAWGEHTLAQGRLSTAWGEGTKAFARSSTAWGDTTVASGLLSTVWGKFTTASGEISTAWGFGTTARSGYETALGTYNTIYTPSSTTGWHETDRLFVIGNGINSANRSDAFVILKNAKAGFGTSTPDARLVLSSNENEDALRVMINNDTKMFLRSNGGLAIGEVFTETPENGLSVAGNVGIGTGQPLAKLHVERTSSNTNPQLRLHSQTTNGFARVRMSTEGHSEVWDIRTGGSNNNLDFMFATNQSIMTLRGETKRVGVGLTNPSDQLHVVAAEGENAFRVQVEGVTRLRVFSNGGVGVGSNYTEGTVPVGGMRVSTQLFTGGSVGVGTANPGAFMLAVDGDAAKPGGGSWSAFSDSRLKNSIEPIKPGMLDHLLQLNGYTFEYEPEAIEKRLALPGRQTGLIAQEVQQVFPDWVESDDDGYLYVTERGLTAIIVEALRELREEKDAEIANLKAEKEAAVANLSARLQSLEILLNADNRQQEIMFSQAD